MHSAKDWHPPHNWTRITSVDCHAAGEPLRVVTGGWPELPGNNMLERHRYQRQHYDYLRRALILEPRGHADMYGCILTPPVTAGAHRGVLFMHNEGYSSMCGHGTIGLATVLLETGMEAATTPATVLRLDTPAGLVTARAQWEAGRVRSVALENVPSFALALDLKLDVAGVGPLRVDVAFGGAFYAFCEAAEAGVEMTPKGFHRLIEVGMAIKSAVTDVTEIVHPFEQGLSFLYGTIFIGLPANPAAHSRNVCIFADGAVDRSPCGTGISARAALLHARGEIGVDEPFTVESIIDTCFTGRILRTAKFGNYDAVVPEVEGNAYIVGHHEWLICPDDPLREGFLLR